MFESENIKKKSLTKIDFHFSSTDERYENYNLIANAIIIRHKYFTLNSALHLFFIWNSCEFFKFIHMNA